MEMQIPRPLPAPDLDTQPYWDAAKEGKLVAQYDPKAGKYWHPPLPYMPTGAGFDFEWKELSGRGKVYSYTIIYPPAHPAFNPPYGVVLVEMEGAPGAR